MTTDLTVEQKCRSNVKVKRRSGFLNVENMCMTSI